MLFCLLQTANVPICVCVDHLLGLERASAGLDGAGKCKIQAPMSIKKLRKNEEEEEEEEEEKRVERGERIDTCTAPYVNVKNNNNKSNKKQIWRSQVVVVELILPGLAWPGCGRLE